MQFVLKLNKTKKLKKLSEKFISCSKSYFIQFEADFVCIPALIYLKTFKREKITLQLIVKRTLNGQPIVLLGKQCYISSKLNFEIAIWGAIF